MFYQKLNIPVPKWNLESIIIPKPADRLYEKHYENVVDIVPGEILDKFDSINMIPEYVRIFQWPINHCGIWHIDGNLNDIYYSSINWIIKGSGLIQFNNSLELFSRPNAPSVYKFRTSTLNDPVEAETDGHGCLIDTSSCHRVITGKDGRTSISLGYVQKDIPVLLMLEKLAIARLI